MISRLLAKYIKIFGSKKSKFELKFLGRNKYFQIFFFQKVLGINRHVNWPVHHSSVIGNPSKIIQKDVLPFVGFHPSTYVNTINEIHIGTNVRLGPRISLISGNHDLNDFTRHIKGKPIKIGDNCWLGANVVVLPGVELGNHVIVAAGSVVTKSFGNDCVIGGVPANILRTIDEYSGIKDWTAYIRER